jgi:cytochrome c553
MKALILAGAFAAASVLAGPAMAAGDAAAGKAKAAACGTCHGADGHGTQMGPKLAGLNEATFVQAMQDYASGKRAHVMMKMQAAKLSAQDDADLAAYYATLK